MSNALYVLSAVKGLNGGAGKTTLGLWEVSGVILLQNWFVITFQSPVCTFYIFFLCSRLGLIVKLILKCPT